MREITRKEFLKSTTGKNMRFTSYYVNLGTVTYYHWNKPAKSRGIKGGLFVDFMTPEQREREELEDSATYTGEFKYYKIEDKHFRVRADDLYLVFHILKGRPIKRQASKVKWQADSLF